MSAIASHLLAERILLMIWNKDLKNYKAIKGNALTAFGYILRNVFLTTVLILIVTIDWEQII